MEKAPAELLSNTEPTKEYEEPPRTPGRWIALAWFLLGVLVGAVGLALFTTSPIRSGTDSTAMREAAREGMLDAIATLNATQGQVPERGTPAPVKTSFNLRDANRLGNKNAPVTIVEFSDFQCPYCQKFHQAIAPALIKDYVNTGKATIVYKHSAFLGQESVGAAQAAECAADQARFWPYHDLLFARQAGENRVAFTKDHLLGFARELGLDMTRFEPCLNNAQTQSRVQADTQEGEAAGVRGTPTFFVNGRPLVGAQPLEAFQAAIEQALKQ